MATATLPTHPTDPPPPTTSTRSIPPTSSSHLPPPSRPLSLGSTPSRTHSARIVGLRNMSSEVTATKTTMQTITIPGLGRSAVRRHAVDFTSGLSAYVVKAGEEGVGNMVSVSMKMVNGKLLSTTLKGHKNDIVDVEFLRSGDFGRVYTLGSCDKDGVVYLWFLKHVLEGQERLELLRYYSFYSLRKSRYAYFTRIRLAGTVEKGVMVLCPNDGSDVRVIQFRCVPNKVVGDKGEGGVPVIVGAGGLKEGVEGGREYEEAGEGGEYEQGVGTGEYEEGVGTGEYEEGGEGRGYEEGVGTGEYEEGVGTRGEYGEDTGAREYEEGLGAGGEYGEDVDTGGLSGKKMAGIGAGVGAGMGAGAGYMLGRDGDRDEEEEEEESVEDAESVEEDGVRRGDEEYTGTRDAGYDDQYTDTRDRDYGDQEVRGENVGQEEMMPQEMSGQRGADSYTEPHTEPIPGRTAMAGVIGSGTGNPSRVETGVSEATTTTATDLEPEKNKTYPLSQEEFGEVEVDDDIAAATAQAAGIEHDEEEAVEGEYEKEEEEEEYVEYGDDDEYKDARGSDSEYEDEYEDQIPAGNTHGVPTQSHTA